MCISSTICPPPLCSRDHLLLHGEEASGRQLIAAEEAAAASQIVALEVLLSCCPPGLSVVGLCEQSLEAGLLTMSAMVACCLALPDWQSSQFSH